MTLFRRLTLAWFIVTLIILGLPSGSFPSTSIPHADKIVHFLIFAVGSFVAVRGWPNRILLVVLLLLLFAPLAEIWQHILPTRRHADPMDALANATGVIVGLTLALLSLRVVSRRSN